MARERRHPYLPKDLKSPHVVIIGHSDDFSDPDIRHYRDMTVEEALREFDSDYLASINSERHAEMDGMMEELPEEDDLMIYHDFVITSDSPITLHEGL